MLTVYQLYHCIRRVSLVRFSALSVSLVAVYDRRTRRLLFTGLFLVVIVA